MMGTATTKAQWGQTFEARTLEPYRLVETLGENALDTVHLARLDGAHGFPRWVALRVFDGRAARDHARVHRRCDEARAAASIAHPNLMAVVDVGQSDGTWWIATEHLLGESAHEILLQAERAVVPVPWAIATRIVADAADALGALHARGAVHGAVVPRGLLVTYAGTTKVKGAFASRSDRDAEPRDAAYAPPWAAGAPDAHADVYALAAILWELCAGRRIEVWDARAPREVRSLAQGFGVPASIDTIVQRALGRDGASHGTARELARALRGALVVEGVVVEEHDVGRYVQSRFADRRAHREAQLHEHDSDVTEVFRFTGVEAPPDTEREVPWSGDDDDDADRTVVVRKRDLPAEVRSFVKAQPVIVIGPGVPSPAPSPVTAPPAPAEARVLVPSVAPTIAELEAPREKKRGRGALLAMLLVAIAAGAFLLARNPRSVALLAQRFHRAGPAAPAAKVDPPAPRAISAAPPAVPAPPPAIVATPAMDAPTAIVTTTPNAPAAAPSAPTAAPSAERHAATSKPAPAKRPRAPETATPRATGQLTVVCVPACDDVLDEGRSLGPSPVFRATVGAGEHHLTLVVSEPSIEKQVTVDVAEDQTALVHEDME